MENSIDMLPELFVPLPSGERMPCAVALSPRAKYVRVRLSAQGDLTLLVPTRRKLSPTEALQILHDMASWIDNALQRLQRRNAKKPQAAPLTVPDSIALPALGEVWQVYCVTGPANSTRDRVTLREQTGNIVLRGTVENTALCCRMLQKWLLPHAKDYLTSRVRELAHKFGFTVNAVRVRGQRSRWGSCSALGNINVNYRLIVLDTHLVDYLILHELCHLRHMNHSAAFKACLHSYEPQWAYFEKALNTAWANLPPWVVHRAVQGKKR